MGTTSGVDKASPNATGPKPAQDEGAAASITASAARGS